MNNTEKGKPVTATIVVPAGASVAGCRSACGAEIYWVRMPSGKMAPIDCDPSRVVGARKPVAGVTAAQRAQFAMDDDDMMPRDGLGAIHFTTCPNAAQFRRPR